MVQPVPASSIFQHIPLSVSNYDQQHQPIQPHTLQQPFYPSVGLHFNQIPNFQIPQGTYPQSMRQYSQSQPKQYPQTPHTQSHSVPAQNPPHSMTKQTPFPPTQAQSIPQAISFSLPKQSNAFPSYHTQVPDQTQDNSNAPHFPQHNNQPTANTDTPKGKNKPPVTHFRYSSYKRTMNPPKETKWHSGEITTSGRVTVLLIYSFFFCTFCILVH